MRLTFAVFLGLSACGSGSSEQSDAAPDVTTDAAFDASTVDAPLEAEAAALVTINGHVVDPLGQPRAYLPVSAGGHVTGSDANGNFSIKDVAVPYDLAIIDTDAKFAYVYQGLTRLDPIATLAPTGTPRKTTLSVTTTGSPIASGAHDDVQWVASGVRAAPNSTLQTTDGFAVDASWLGPASLQAKVHVLQAQKGGTSFAYGSASSLFQDGANPSVPITLNAVTTTTVTGAVTLPSNFNLSYVAVGLYDKSVKPATSATLAPFYSAQAASLPTSLSFPSPATGLDTYVFLVATDGNASYSELTALNPTTPLSLTLQSPLTLTAPSDNAVNVPLDGTLSWTAVASSSYVVALVASPGPLNEIVVVTSSTSLKIPDLTALGYPMPHGITCKWAVDSFGPAASTDDVAIANQGNVGAIFTDYAIVTSAPTRSFTLAP